MLMYVMTNDEIHTLIINIMNFNELPIENKLKNSIKFADFKTPTPIQSLSIPIDDQIYLSLTTIPL